MEDRRAVAAQRRLDLDGAGVVGPVDGGDPYSAGWKNQLAPQRPGWFFGVIVDVMPGGYAYRVSAGQNSFVWCSSGGTTAGFGVSGGRSLTTYVVGTPVWFVKHPETPSYGTIVHAEPHPSAHTANQPADTIWPFIRSGQRAEISHQFPVIASQTLGGLTEAKVGNVDGADFSAGRPLDSTAVGEWGVMMETGVGVFADPHQAYMRVDEATGVFMFYADQLVRVAGVNFQQFTSLTEAEELDDEGELAGVKRKLVYPWEKAGLWRWNQVTAGWQSAGTPNHGYPAGQGLALKDPLATQSAVGVAPSEPEFYNQISAARGFEYDGYLGQGGKTLIAAPVQLDWAYPSLSGAARTTPAGWVPYFTNTDGSRDASKFAPSGRLTVDGAQGPTNQPYAVPPNVRGGPSQPGLFEEHKTLAGGWHVRSATRIILAKRASIPTPRPLKRAEDPYGDSPTTGPATYRPSGLNISGATATHLVQSGLSEPSYGPPQRAGALFDILSYAFNWENVHPFAYHARDWALAQEGAAGSTLVNTRVPDYTLLAAQQYLAEPAPQILDIDHRYGPTPVYENESSVCLLEDGTVLITDGWGSEIRMHSGDISLRCAGDISLFPGRNLITWAGHDVVMKAHDSMDLTAAHGDLRTKAQKNSHHLAGNDQCSGGFIFETKSVCPVLQFADKTGEEVLSSGFTILAPKSEFLVLAQDATIKLEDTSEDGKITLNAGADRHIRTYSNTFVSRIGLDGVRMDLFDGTTDDAGDFIPGSATANEFTATNAYFGTNLSVYGTGFFWASLITAEWLIAGQNVTTVNAGAGAVPVYSNGAAITAEAQSVEDRYDYLVETYKEAVEEEVYYPAGGDDAEFTHRTTTQYLTSTFVFWESRWHTMARNDGQILPWWTEPKVVALRSEIETLPHPGGRWLSSDGYRGQDPSYTLYASGWVARNRDTDRTLYETADFPAPRAAATLSNNVTITVQYGE